MLVEGLQLQVMRRAAETAKDRRSDCRCLARVRACARGVGPSDAETTGRSVPVSGLIPATWRQWNPATRVFLPGERPMGDARLLIWRAGCRPPPAGADWPARARGVSRRTRPVARVPLAQTYGPLKSMVAQAREQARHTTADRMAALRKSDRRRVYLCAGALRKRVWNAQPLASSKNRIEVGDFSPS